jgi:hypothetical protein
LRKTGNNLPATLKAKRSPQPALAGCGEQSGAKIKLIPTHFLREDKFRPLANGDNKKTVTFVPALQINRITKIKNRKNDSESED